MLRDKTYRPIFARIIAARKVGRRQNFFRRVDYEREQPLAISLENLPPRDKYFVAEDAETSVDSVISRQIIGLPHRDIFSNRVDNFFRKLPAALHDLPVVKWNVAELAIIDDNIILAQKIFSPSAVKNLR